MRFLPALLPALAALAAALIAAPAAADPLLQRLIADAAASPAVGLPFERTVTVTMGDRKSTLVQRYQPGRTPSWTLVSIDGRTPTADESSDFRKSTAATPPPAYARVGKMLAAGARKIPGTSCYRVDRLPPELFPKDIRSNIDKIALDACVGGPPDRPFVTQTRAHTIEGFRARMVAKVESFEAVTRYVLGPDGRPRIREQTQALRGSALGNRIDSDTLLSYRDL